MPVNLFNVNFYRAANSDLANFSDAQGLSHFQDYGLNEGRAFSPFVNLNFYRSSNSDLAGLNNEQIFDHLQNYGVREGRHFSPLVDLKFYRASNGDLAGLNNEQIFEHLRNYGVAEGRRFSPFVDLNFYRAANFDLNAANLDNRQLLEHLANYGVEEGRRFSVAFDSNYYRNFNSDLAAARLNNTQLLEHFELYGLSEGRASSESFNVSYYLSHNSDLQAAQFNNQQAQQHFEIYGIREGRQSAPLNPITIPKNVKVGNTLDTAFSLGVLLSGSRSFSDFIGTTDSNDYYRFTLAHTSNFNLSLTGLTDYANVELIFDSNGNGQVDYNETLDSSYGSSSYSGSINEPLGAGTYFIRVYTDSSNNTNYTLKVSAIATPSPILDPGSTLNTAYELGFLSGTRSSKQFVGSADRNDYYRFTLAGNSNFNLSLTGLTDYAEVQLIFDSNGNSEVDYDETVDSSYGSSSYSGSINETLGAGTYFIRVYTDSSNNTNYTLYLSA